MNADKIRMFDAARELEQSITAFILHVEDDLPGNLYRNMGKAREAQAEMFADIYVTIARAIEE
jgi:hypothetical protein